MICMNVCMCVCVCVRVYVYVYVYVYVCVFVYHNLRGPRIIKLDKSRRSAKDRGVGEATVFREDSLNFGKVCVDVFFLRG